MNELLKIILSLSVSGALLILVLLLCKPLVKDKLSKRWQYYIWLVVVARLLLPFAPETNFVGTLFQYIDNAIIQTDTSPRPEQKAPVLPETDFSNQGNVPGQVGSGGEQSEPNTLAAPSIFDLAKQNIAAVCLLVWLIVAACLLIRKVTVYQSFVKYIKAGRSEIADMELWERVGKLVEQTGVKGAVGLYTNSLISSPLLIGFFRPCIMLPTTELSESDFENTILHELTHYKRRDMFYKWLVQVTICLHWFNPLVYLMGREVNRTCELSCDEAVIKSMDAGKQRAYGDTLLNAMGTGGNYKDSVASVTLNEGKELLKERLDAIMRFKKATRFTSVISTVLACVMLLGATAAGAYATPGTSPSAVAQNAQTDNDETKIEVDVDRLKQSEQVTYGPYFLRAGTIWGADISWAGNGMISVSCKSNNNYAGEQLVQQVQPPITHEFTIQEDGEYIFTITNQYALSQKYKLDSFVTKLSGIIYTGNKPNEIQNQSSKSDKGDEKNLSQTPPTVQSADHVTVNFSGVTITGQGPVGVELVRTRDTEVSFDFLNMDNEDNCTTKATVINGIMQISVNNYVPNGLNVNFGPDYKNVVRVNIPDAVYTKFDIQATEMVVQMQDFNAPVHVETDRAGFWLIDKIISQGTYNIKVTSGPLYIEADTILRDITANAYGPLTVRFNKIPENLYLDSTDCGPTVIRPEDWPAIFKIGNETPKIVLSNTGRAKIEIYSDDTSDTTTR